MRQLDGSGPELELKLSTALAEKIVISQRIEGLVVRGNNEKVKIPLPKSYSRSSIPAKQNQIPRPEYQPSTGHTSAEFPRRSCL